MAHAPPSADCCAIESAVTACFLTDLWEALGEPTLLLWQESLILKIIQQYHQTVKLVRRLDETCKV
jgi:hypothetical protein